MRSAAEDDGGVLGAGNLRHLCRVEFAGSTPAGEFARWTSGGELKILNEVLKDTPLIVSPRRY